MLLFTVKGLQFSALTVRSQFWSFTSDTLPSGRVIFDDQTRSFLVGVLGPSFCSRFVLAVLFHPRLCPLVPQMTRSHQMKTFRPSTTDGSAD